MLSPPDMPSIIKSGAESAIHTEQGNNQRAALPETDRTFLDQHFPHPRLTQDHM